MCCRLWKARCHLWSVLLILQSARSPEFAFPEVSGLSKFGILVLVYIRISGHHFVANFTNIVTNFTNMSDLLYDFWRKSRHYSNRNHGIGAQIR